MDKRSILGFVLIGLILIVWLYIQNQNSDKEKQKKEQITKQIEDSLKKILPIDTLKKEVKKDTIKIKTETPNDTLKYGMLFHKFEKGEDKIIRVETDKYYAEFSTKGGALIKYELKGFSSEFLIYKELFETTLSRLGNSIENYLNQIKRLTD
ncbi:MAG: hypothetical protein ABSF32_06975, partial [Ignavibacteria bacterium]